jgi:hypothetical protein
MAGHAGEYWDFEECRWVPYATPGAELPVPQQEPPPETAVAKAGEGDVRSG